MEGATGGELEGLWATREGPRRRRVSAVLVESNHRIPKAAARRAPTLRNGHWAEPLVAALLLAKSMSYCEDSRLEFQATGATMAEVLGSPDRWPTGEPFPASQALTAVTPVGANRIRP